MASDTRDGPQPEPLPEVRGGKETILIVEDEDSVRSLVGHVLRHYGYQVLEASDGRKALGIAEQVGSSIDLVVTDLDLHAARLQREQCEGVGGEIRLRDRDPAAIHPPVALLGADHGLDLFGELPAGPNQPATGDQSGLMRTRAALRRRTLS